MMFMELRIEGKKTFGDIQHEFNATFPFLKIECLNSEHTSEEYPAIHKIKTANSPCGNKLINAEATISINDDTTVASLVKTFTEKFGLAIRVLRKSDRMWIEISLTDNWTLGRQNSAGSQLNTT